MSKIANNKLFKVSLYEYMKCEYQFDYNLCDTQNGDLEEQKYIIHCRKYFKVYLHRLYNVKEL